MKKSGIAVVLAMLLLASCGEQGKEVVTESGFKYTVLAKGTEEIPPGDMVMVSFVAKDANDSVWMDSRPDGMPRPARKVDSIWTMNQGGLEEALFYMKNGDSITCQVPVEKVYGSNRPLPAGVEAGSMLTIDLKIEDAMNEEEFGVYRQEMVAKQREMAAEKAEEQLATDIELIDAYLTENNIDAQKTESGLRYVITQEGSGDNIQSGQKAKIDYSGYVLNGGYFDSSNEEIAKEHSLYNAARTYGPYETVIGQRAVIAGWDEAFQLMNEGTKGTLYIPSGLAYGPQARGAQIPANSILVFDVEVVEIIKE